jgi:hypothetical protein
MDKAAGLGLVFRDQVSIDVSQVAPPVTDFAWGPLPLRIAAVLSARRPGADKGTEATTSRINETIDGSVFDRWRADADYRPPNLAAWAKEKNVDPGKLAGAVGAADPKVGVA